MPINNPSTPADNSITNTKLADMAQSTIKGRAVGAGTGDPTDLSAAQATAILNVFTSALQGLVPASGGGTTNFLRADGTFAAPGGGGGAFTSVVIQSFEASGTYTPTSGMKFCIVTSTGAGGGGGGADTPGASGQVGVGGGGGAGGTCIELFDAATIGASQVVTIGAVGTGGSGVNGTNGVVGGNTTFGALHTANGGNGGQGSANIAATFSARTGGVGGLPSGGLLNIQGGSGENGIGFSVDGTTDICFGAGGNGGASFWGGGARGAILAQTSLTADQQLIGNNMGLFGGGGGGASCLTSTTGANGGNGGPGVIMILEFI